MVKVQLNICNTSAATRSCFVGIFNRTTRLHH